MSEPSDNRKGEPVPGGEWQPEESPPRRGLRPLAWVGIAFGVLLLLVVAGITWMLNTQSGAQWVANRAVGALGGKLEVREVSGTLASPLVISGVRWRDDASGVDVHVARVSLDWAMRELFSKRVHVKALDVNGVDVRLFEHPPKPDEPNTFSLTPPLDVLLDRFTLKGARVSQDGKDVFVANSAAAVGSWTGKGVEIQKLLVDSPDGNVHLNGEVSEHGSYVGRATGGFRWKVSDVDYAGDLTATSEKEQLAVNLRLTAPFSAKLDAQLGESKALPWKFNLTVPTFDPREKLLPGSSLESLAATLRGEGDLTVAEVRGNVTLNGQSVRIEPVRARYADNIVKLETLTLIDPAGRGTLTANGEVRLGEAAAAASAQPATAAPPPFFANLSVSWKDVSLPKEWVGQPLATHGELKVIGTTATFTADGQLAAGPSGRHRAGDRGNARTNSGEADRHHRTHGQS